jgi:Ca2+-binding RTX toxin-like protein
VRACITCAAGRPPVRAKGGSGNDLLLGSGLGGPGDDTLSCFPRRAGCYLNGAAGHEVLTGGTRGDRLFGEGGHDLVRAGDRDDLLDGGPGNDRLIGGAGVNELEGGAGADRLRAREDRSAGEKRGRTASTVVPAAATRRLSTGPIA